MLRATLTMTTVLALSACSTVESETFTTIDLNGRDYQLRTRTINGPQGTFETHAIRAGDGSFRSCDPQSPQSCRAALNTRRSSD
ncbi:MAG: hypothetical protein WBV62_11450 [Roseobacter sp.]